MSELEGRFGPGLRVGGFEDGEKTLLVAREELVRRDNAQGHARASSICPSIYLSIYLSFYVSM